MVTKTDVDGKHVKFQLWDTAGQERFRTITSSYYRGAHAVLVFFDISDSETFNNTQKWLQEIDRYACDSVTRVLVGQKKDLDNQRRISSSDCQEFAESLNLQYIEVSAKTGEGCDDVLRILMKEIRKAIDDEPVATPQANPNPNTPALPSDPNAPVILVSQTMQVHLGAATAATPPDSN